MATIPVGRRGHAATVDDCDFARLSAHKWALHTNGYAFRRCGNRSIYMHREVMDAQKGTEVDHINCDKLDNRRANLRFCTRHENMRLQRVVSHRPTKRPDTPDCQYRGVYWMHSSKGLKAAWRAQLKVNKKVIRCGRHATAEAAARAYDDAVRAIFGEVAWLNFPKSQGAA